MTDLASITFDQVYQHDPQGTVHPDTVVTLFGDVIAGTIIGRDPITGAATHTWTADGHGTFYLSGITAGYTSLTAEWQHFHTLLATGHGAELNAIQRLEANAETVFENTGLAHLGAVAQERDREDVQREFDAMADAMYLNSQGPEHIDPTQAFTLHTYLMLERTLQSTPELLELGIQGHGLNNPPGIAYRGYTNHFQNNVDGQTLYIGGGLDNNENALTDFFDDVVLSHAPFPTVWQDGHFEQLNQNGQAEDRVEKSIIALDDAAFLRIYTAADFSTTASHTHDGYVSSFTQMVTASFNVTATAGHEVTLYRDIIDDSMTIHAASNGARPNAGLHAGDITHVWHAGADGLFHLTGNGDFTSLEAEWKFYYHLLQTGHGAELNAAQRQEANAEAVFENTGLARLNAATQLRDREDAQRQIDAEGEAMWINAQGPHGVNPTAKLTEHTTILLERTIQSHAALQELGIQGHGLNAPPSAKYRGYTQDFQNNVDNRTVFVGGGLDHNESALAAFFDDVILSHAPFPIVVQNGHFIQLNQNGQREDTLHDAVRGMNEAMYTGHFGPKDFRRHR